MKISAFLQLNIKFHGEYPEKPAIIRITDSANIDDVEWFENEISKIVRRRKNF